MNKYPITRQTNMSDCGVCSLSMIIHYHHGNIPLNTIRTNTHTTKNGTSALNIVKYANLIGFEAHGYKLTYDNLVSTPKPFIAHLLVDNKYYHYVVVYDINNDILTIGDPQDGLRNVNKEDFLKMWDNVIITFLLKKKLPEIKEVKISKFIMTFLNKYRLSFLKLLVLSILITVFGIISSFAFESLISTTNITDTFLFFFIIIINEVMFKYIRNRILMNLNRQMDTTLTVDTFNSIIDLPYCYFENNSTGDIVSRMNDIGSFKEMISNLYLTLTLDTIISLTSYIVLYHLDSSLALYAILIFISYLSLTLIFYPKLKNNISDMQTKKSLVSSYMVESLRGYMTIYYENLNEYAKEKFNKYYRSLIETYYEYAKRINYETFLKDIIGKIGDIVIILIGIIRIKEGNYEIGHLITFHILLQYCLEPIKSIVSSDVSLKEGHNALKRILELTQVPKEEIKDNIPEGDIKLANMHFAYNEGSALHNINLELKQGEKTLVLGTSGSGKSTLFKLLIGCYKVGDNMIEIGDKNINMFDSNKLKKFITYVSQNETLFTGTIYENIVLDKNINREELKNVLNTCELNKICDGSGIYRIVLEGGTNLSGGERERIYLARALLRHTKYLVLDESLSEIDISLERKIIKNINNNYPDTTMILISHRLDNMDLFDHVITMSDGTIQSDIRKPQLCLNARKELVYG